MATPCRVHGNRAAALLAAGMLSLGSTTAIAQVYKCVGEGGRPVYQEMPCPSGKELRNFQSDPPEITVLPGVSNSPGVATPPTNARPAKEANSDKTAKSRSEKLRGDPAERRHLHSGMSEGEVLARVGTPDVTSGAKNKQLRWTWLPAEGDPETITTVTFASGVVTTVERKLIKK